MTPESVPRVSRRLALPLTSGRARPNASPEMGTMPRPDPSKSKPPRKFPAVLSPPSIPMPCLVCSRCRMDRERFDAGGRECPPIRRANVSVASRGEAMANAVPLAAHFPSGLLRQPATGPGSAFLPAGGSGRPVWACGGHGATFTPCSVPERAPKASPAVCPNRGRGNPGGGPRRGAGEEANLRVMRG